MVSNKDQQRQFEQLVISEMNPNLNKIRAYRTEEQKREYYSENKGQMKEHQKEYQKEYRNENKESISEKGKIKIHCPYCDKYTRRSDISKHIKTKNHIKNLYFYYHNFIYS